MFSRLDIAVRLSKSYDPELLRRDLTFAQEFTWANQAPFQLNIESIELHHDGLWRGVSLYGKGGRWDTATPGIGLEPYSETEVLYHTPYIKSILDGLLCPKFSVRLMSLPPGGEIKTHTDSQIGFGFGTLRLHIPITTHSDVVFVIGNEQHQWMPGELWFGDFSLPHYVRNDSPINRVHLIMDLAINDYLLSLFPLDVVERKRQMGIMKYSEPINLSEQYLSQFVCNFVAPVGFLSSEEQAGSITLQRGELVLRLDEVDAFALQPIGRTCFRPLGGALSLFFIFSLSDSRVHRLRVVNLNGIASEASEFTITDKF